MKEKYGPIMTLFLLICLAAAFSEGAGAIGHGSDGIDGSMGAAFVDDAAALRSFGNRDGGNLLLAFNDGYRLANPDWVHPFNRKNYPGYARRRENKKNSRAWSYKTNRPGGNTRGGGTTAYYRYRSFYRNTLKSPVKRRK